MQKDISVVENSKDSSDALPVCSSAPLDDGSGGMSASAETIVAAFEASATTAATAAAREVSSFSSRNLLTLFIFLLLIAGLYFAYILLAPFFNTMVLAVVFAALFYPVYVFFLNKTNGKESFSALVVIVFVTIVVIFPLTLLIVGFISQMRQSVTAVTGWLSGGNLDIILNNYLSPLFAWIQEEAPFLGITQESAKSSIIDAARNVGQRVFGFSANLVGQTLTFVLHFLLFLLALFFFLKDGAGMMQYIKYLTPLREEQEERIIENMRRISRAVLMGSFLVAALQGVVGGIGLAIVGIPALFWGTAMAFTALVPVLGTGLVWVPVVFVLLIGGEWKSALFLTLWCGVLVTSIDTFLRPLLSGCLRRYAHSVPFSRYSRRYSGFWIFWSALRPVDPDLCDGYVEDLC